MSTITLEDFANPKHEWHAKNDPVMGGKSHATVTIDADNGLAIFDGEVVDVPFLQAPGFVTAESSQGISYPDVSSCSSLRFNLQSAQEYDGYRVSFGKRHVPGNRFAFGYKANLDAPLGPAMGVVDIPFQDFTVRWDDATGDPIVTCKENNDFCPDAKTLQNMQTISLWGEGVAGKVHLEVASIEAIGCGSSTYLDNFASAETADTADPIPISLVVALFAAAALIGGIVGSIFVKKKRTEGYAQVGSSSGTCTTGSTV